MFSHSITPWLHILAATVWVGPQFFLFLAAVPAVRTIEDQQVRARVMRVITQRFGWMAWAALVVLVLTGISTIYQENDDTGVNILSSDFRYFHLFSTKMLLVGIMVMLTAMHAFIIGPRQLELAEQGGDEAELARLRRTSMIISGTILLLSIAVIFVAALLANHEYSLQPS